MGDFREFCGIIALMAVSIALGFVLGQPNAEAQRFERELLELRTATANAQRVSRAIITVANGAPVVITANGGVAVPQHTRALVEYEYEPVALDRVIAAKEIKK